MQVVQQKSTDQFWKDEAGIEVPYNRITPYERNVEKTVAKISRDAVSLNEKLTSFKKWLAETTTKLYDQFLIENDGNVRGKGKGNVVFYNFDRSIKIEVSVNEQITFDDNLIGLAKERLYKFIDNNVAGLDSFIKDLIMSAFETSRGKLDTKKVLSLKKHSSRIKDTLYHDAMDFIDKAIRRPESKTYFRVWIKDGNGEYQSIDLNLSSINA